MQRAVVEVTEGVSPSDARLVHDARAGDIRAFEAIVTATLPRAYRLASAILGTDGAPEAVENAFVAAWRELPRMSEPQRFDGWFRRILLDECRMQVRRNSGATAVLVDRASEAPLDAWDTTETQRVGVIGQLEDAFERLDADDRAMVVMFHLEGRSVADIAGALHMPAGTVKWRLDQARQALRLALDAAR